MMKKITRLTLLIALLATLAVPLTASAQSGGPFSACFQLQNLEAGSATITVTYYNQDGTVSASVGDSINGNASKTYCPLSSVPSGFNGSVVVSSNTKLAAITNVLKSDSSGGESYGGFSAGATTVNIPLIMKANFGFSTWFNVQNAGSALATVNVTYAGNPTPPGGCPESQSVAVGAAKTFDQSTNSCLPSGFVGAATVTSAQSIVATVVEVLAGGNSVLIYNGFTSANASTTPVMPLVSTNFFGSQTGIQIQNTGGSSTDVTVSYTPSTGFPGTACSETKSIAAGASTTFFLPYPTACGTAFVGAAKVTVNSSSMPLVAIVNQLNTGAGDSSSYGAFSPAGATDKVSLPLIMDRNFGYFTGFAIANVGTQATTVNCTFTNSAVTVSALVQPGTALTNVQADQIANGYVGSATCTATGGDQKIVGVVNESLSDSPVANDGLLTYEGFNY